MTNKNENPLFQVDEQRIIRNRLLQASDQMMMMDRPTDKEAWKTYRQRLRDIPAQDDFPDNIDWPISPDDLKKVIEPVVPSEPILLIENKLAN